MPSVQPIPPREQTFKNESLMLSPYAFQSINASGRRRERLAPYARTFSAIGIELYIAAHSAGLNTKRRYSLFRNPIITAPALPTRLRWLR